MDATYVPGSDVEQCEIFKRHCFEMYNYSRRPCAIHVRFCGVALCPVYNRATWVDTSIDQASLLVAEAGRVCEADVLAYVARQVVTESAFLAHYLAACQRIGERTRGGTIDTQLHTGANFSDIAIARCLECALLLARSFLF